MKLCFQEFCVIRAVERQCSCRLVLGSRTSLRSRRPYPDWRGRRMMGGQEIEASQSVPRPSRAFGLEAPDCQSVRLRPSRSALFSYVVNNQSFD